MVQYASANTRLTGDLEGAFDRGRKHRIHAQAAVPHAWPVNPIERRLEVLRPRDGAWTIVAVFTGAEPVRAEPFDAVPLVLAELWVDSPSTCRPGGR